MRIEFPFLVLLIAALTASTSFAQEGNTGKPNIILIMADDLGIGDVGYTGFNPYVETPALDVLARSGIRFDRFYSQSPVCSPTRGSALTGRHPFRYGIFEANVGCLRGEETAIPELLSQEGYQSGHFGKWHLGAINDSCHIKKMCPADPFEFGYDYYFATHHSIATYNPNIHLVEGGPDSLNLDSTYIRNGLLVKELLYGDDSKIVMNEAVDFIDRNRSGPFFSTIWFHTPHKPVVGPPELKAYYDNKYPGELSDKQLDYYAAITAMDMQIGRLRDSLESWGISENTMIWFCSDNGPTGAGETGIYKGAKRHLFEGGVRVPGILVWPGKIKGSRIETAVATTSDFLPTILDAIGSELPTLQPLDGVSLMPVIENVSERRPAPLCFQSHGSMVCITEDFKLMQAGYKASVNLGLETGIIHNREEWMLFDMHEDSLESVNIIAQHPETADSLREVLNQWMETVYSSFTGTDYEGSYTPEQSYRFGGGVSGQATEDVAENRLGGIYVNGLLLPGFSPDVYTYHINLLEEKIPDIVVFSAAANAMADTIILPTNLVGTREERTSTIKVLAENQSLATYSVEFSLISNDQNAYLKEVRINDEKQLDFSPYRSNYFISLPYGTTEVPTIDATPSSQDATVEITQASQITNAKERKRTASIWVISQSGTDSLEYRFVFSVGVPSSGTLLSDLLINNQSIGGFSPHQCTYYLEVPDSTAQYLIEGISFAEGSSVRNDTIFTKKNKLEPSSGIIEITAPNGIAKWTYEVIILPVADTSGWSDTTASFIRSTTKLDLCIYPNPCSRKLYIKTDVENFIASIYDSSGKLLVEKRNRTVLDIEKLGKGIYFLAINDVKNSRLQRVRFIKL